MAVFFLVGEIKRSLRTLQAYIDGHVVAADEQSSIGYDEPWRLTHPTGLLLHLHALDLFLLNKKLTSWLGLAKRPATHSLKM